jgi:hypothetical protein
MHMFSNSQGAAVAPAAELQGEAGLGMDARLTAVDPFASVRRYF